MKKLKWKSEFILQTYILAEQGKNQEDISKVFNIDRTTFIAWKKKHPALRTAYRQGIKARKNGNGKAKMPSFQDYVYGRLPTHLQDCWNKINKLKNKDNGIEILETILEKQGKIGRQYLFIHSLTQNCFNLSAALRTTNTSHGTFLKWKENDSDFADLIEELKFHMKNFCESALIKLVRLLDPPTVRFVNERLNRDRGYGAEVRVTGNNLPVQQTNVINIEQLNLTLEEKKDLLGKIQERKQVDSEIVAPKLITGKE